MITTTSRYGWLFAFYMMQIAAYVLFKFGTTAPARWLPCYIAGNVIGVSCMWVLMKLYLVMNANVATGLAIGGGFLCGQIALAVVFNTGISAIQSLGVVITTIGLFVLARG